MYSLTPKTFRSQPLPDHRIEDSVSHKSPHDQSARERGAATVIFALLVPVLFASLAMALDVGKLVYERQHLSNALDAAALAGAASLPSDPVAARNAAVSFAPRQRPRRRTRAVHFWCVVASTGAAKTIVAGQVPSVCDPGSGRRGPSATRSDLRHSVYARDPAISCNSITVSDDKDVLFNFAPAIGIDAGNTGSLASDACKGSCGAQIPNPMDIALVADRTGSMSTAHRDLMVAGIKSTLQTMTREQQYVSLGTIHRSKTTPGTCITTPSTDNTGPWIPVPFSNDYTQNPALPGATPPLNTSQHAGQEA